MMLIESSLKLPARRLSPHSDIIPNSKITKKNFNLISPYCFSNLRSRKKREPSRVLKSSSSHAIHSIDFPFFPAPPRKENQFGDIYLGKYQFAKWNLMGHRDHTRRSDDIFLGDQFPVGDGPNHRASHLRPVLFISLKKKGRQPCALLDWN
ncbi:hypothetical protein TNIN_360591 [Trichonephila inaurata madagascariensis]|uniref:Uncharacterized protein n=1 Tax=Trichonephila inaurata madagascariensis TaxID=2747483 RepID=A0A8X6IG74_9ARAC|nr:hypothetical protein TNIN_360591 [Trichonephila inaurata madagascariensis]